MSSEPSPDQGSALFFFSELGACDRFCVGPVEFFIKLMAPLANREYDLGLIAFGIGLIGKVIKLQKIGVT
jgi:hypothetical protein